MNVRTCKAMALTASLLCLGSLACTDLTVEPKSTATEVNVFTDVASYRAFIAKAYARVVSGRRKNPSSASRRSGLTR